MERRLERILNLLEDLTNELLRGVPVIVEGQRDVEALEDLKLRGAIIPVKTMRGSLLDVVAEIERQGMGEVILLMDFDRRGKQMTKLLTQHLERMRIKPNIIFWKELLSLVSRDIKDIEGLPAYIKTLERKVGRVEE